MKQAYGLSKDRGFQRTYEELKPNRGVKFNSKFAGFQRTYEELKPLADTTSGGLNSRFQRTYEELKPTAEILESIVVGVFSVPMRN